MVKNRYITDINKLKQIGRAERRKLREVQERFDFRCNEYYLSLIDWDDPADPIRRIIIPDTSELDEWGELDAGNESSYTKVPGLEHKYDSVGLLLANDICGGYCRFCFRKRLFMNDNDEVIRDISPGLEYIRRHREITNVLLSGGDPLILSTPKLEKIMQELRDIKHVKIIRLGSKIPVFNPYRILDDPGLLEVLQSFCTHRKRIYMMFHVNHPREITSAVREVLRLLHQRGVITTNQTPLIRGVNDHSEVLAELFRKCSFIGLPPYYVFQCRPTLGNRTFVVPVEESFRVFERAKKSCSGLANRARLVMSHHTGKIEIVGLANSHIVFKYHRAVDPVDNGRIMLFKRNPFAYWFDDYEDAGESSLFGYPTA